MNPTPTGEALPGAEGTFAPLLKQLRHALHEEWSPPAADEAEYRAAGRRDNLRNGRLFLFGLTAALLLWWPTDHIVFAGQTRVLEIYALYRPVLIASGALLYLLIRFVPFFQRHLSATLGLGTAWLCCVVAHGFSQIGGTETPFFHMLYFAMLGPVAFSLSLRRRIVVTLALGAAVALTFFGTNPEHLQDPLALTSVNQLGFSVLVGIGAGGVSERLRRNNFLLRRELARQAAQLEQRVLEQTAELRALTAHTESAREDERTHIARELHDELGQELTALRYALSLAETRYSRDPRSIVSNLRELNDLLNRTAQTTKNIVLDLRPRVLDDLGLAAAAEWLVRRTQERTGIECQLDVDACDLPGPVATAAYRILQEALTNVSRHSHATLVQIAIRCTSKELTLSVRDNGIGFEASRGGHPHSGGMGLIGMRERARAVGGDLRISSPLTQGTLVEASLPIAQVDQEAA